jgi:hypothetical protein
LAHVYDDRNRHQEAEEAYREDVALRKAVAERHPFVREYQNALVADCNYLADFYQRTDRPREAEQAYRDALIAATRLARLRQHAKAADEAREVTSRTATSETLYEVARVYALAAEAAAHDTQLPQAAQSERAAEYAGKAVEQLRRAYQAGYFKERRQVEDLKKHPDLEILRSRQDFQKLEVEVEAHTKAGSQ